MTDKWTVDTGLVFVGVFIILAHKGFDFFIWPALVFVALLIFYPKVFKPLAYVWQKLALLLSYVFSKIFFGFIFFLIITPISLIRKFLKKDSMHLQDWKSVASSFEDRNQVYMPDDFNKAV